MVVTLVQSDNSNSRKTVLGNYWRSFVDVTCYHCHEMGHYSVKCPSSTVNTRTSSQSLQFGLTMTQTTTNIPETDFINPNWILLYTCSTISSFSNRDLFQDICACDAGEELCAYTNWINQYYSYTVTMTVLPFEVFYNKKYISNIHSFPQWRAIS